MLRGLGVCVAAQVLPLSDGSSVTYTSVSLPHLLGVHLSDERVPEGSYGRVLPATPALLARQQPGAADAQLWVGALRTVQDGAAAAWAAAAAAPWFGPLYDVCAERGIVPDIVRARALRATLPSSPFAPPHPLPRSAPPRPAPPRPTLPTCATRPAPVPALPHPPPGARAARWQPRRHCGAPRH